MNFFVKKQKNSLTYTQLYDILSPPVKKGSFFVRLFQPRMGQRPAKSDIAAVIQGGK